jgi:class 3 adenylate cyclase
MPKLPSGTVTFLFTDIEGSTLLLQELGDGYAEALAEHRRTLRAAFARHGGVEVDTQGDAFFVAFSRATHALAAADEGQRELADGPLRV